MEKRKNLLENFNKKSSRKVNTHSMCSFPFSTERKDVEEQVKFKSLYKSSRHLALSNSVSPDKPEITEHDSDGGENKIPEATIEESDYEK